MGAPGGEDVEEVGKPSVGRGPVFTKVTQVDDGGSWVESRTLSQVLQ